MPDNRFIVCKSTVVILFLLAALEIHAQSEYSYEKDYGNECPPGSYPGQNSCEPCPIGTYMSKKQMSGTCVACPSGRTTLRAGSMDIKQCVCKAGFGRPGSDSTVCMRCPQGTYSFGDSFDECFECPFPKTTSFSGATSDKDCVCPGGGGSGPDCDQCPQNMVLMSNGICGCAPGHGGTTCDQCQAGFYSTGGKLNNPRPICRPCGLHFTSQPGAIGPAYCQCEAGYGAGDPGAPMWQHTCELCPIGTFNPGEGMGDRHIAGLAGYGDDSGKQRLPRASPCRPCNQGAPDAHFTTIDVGATSLDQCMCAPGFGGVKCLPCESGTYSPGGRDALCHSCPGEGAGYHTVPQIAATSVSACVCMPGYGMTDKGLCRICPANTFSEGFSKTDCKPCPFGYSSATGSKSIHDCVPTSQPCPVGQVAPLGAVSADQCVCLPGHGGNGSRSGPCLPCPAGTWSPGIDTQPCIPCDFGYTSPQAACSIQECFPINACPIGQWAPKDAVSTDQCACYPGFGGGQTASDPCGICPAGTFSPGHSRDRCIPCGFGYTSPVGSKDERDCYPVDHCPAGTEVPQGQTGSSKQECMCKPGFGSPTGEGTCRLCPTATYSFGGSMEDCKPCPFGTTSMPGAKHIKDCEPIPQECPVGQVALLGAVAASQCVCLPGHGGGHTPSDPCAPCSPGSWSAGHNTQPCVPCGFGYTSPQAATCPEECYPINACPAGTQYPDMSSAPVSIEQCVCKPGFGSSSGKGTCSLCPVGTFSEGDSMEDCKPCPFGFTSAPGTPSIDDCVPYTHTCPIGQWAPLGAVSDAECRCYQGFGGGDSADDACTLCPAGTYSANIGTERCVPCGFGFTSPTGASSAEECYPVDQCPAGTAPTEESLNAGGPHTAVECACKPGYGSVTGEGSCHLCPAGTYSKGGSKEDCVPCPFGYTSAPGTISWKGCVPAAQECPVGQLAPLGAVSEDECGCLPGHGGAVDCGATPTDACTLCPVGTWASGGDTQPCVPCGFGYTSPEGATCPEECYPINACPPGTVLPKYGASSALECVCLPGHGTETQEGPCQICPSGYFSPGFARQPCIPCPFGYTSAPGSLPGGCVPMAQPCPVGQIVDPEDYPVSAADCHCLPGFGGGATPEDACTVCKPGTYSPGIGTQPCFPCPFGFTSPVGSLTPVACYDVDQCPGGTTPATENPSSVAECTCLPGYGSPTGIIGNPCFWCPPDTFNEGYNWDGCKACAEGFFAPSGSPECYPIDEASNRNNTAVRLPKPKPHTVPTKPARLSLLSPQEAAGEAPMQWQQPFALQWDYLSTVQAPLGVSEAGLAYPAAELSTAEPEQAALLMTPARLQSLSAVGQESSTQHANAHQSSAGQRSVAGAAVANVNAGWQSLTETVLLQPGDVKRPDLQSDSGVLDEADMPESVQVAEHQKAAGSDKAISLSNDYTAGTLGGATASVSASTPTQQVDRSMGNTFSNSSISATGNATSHEPHKQQQQQPGTLVLPTQNMPGAVTNTVTVPAS